jgi:hypothetical protein
MTIDNLVPGWNDMASSQIDGQYHLTFLSVMAFPSHLKNGENLDLCVTDHEQVS